MIRKIKINILIALLFLICAAHSPAAQGRKIRVGLPVATPPFAFFDQKLNATRGFCVDLALMAGKVSGSQIEFYGYPDDRKLIQALDNGLIDVIGCTFGAASPDSNYQLIDTGIKVDRHLFAHQSCVTVTCLKDLPNHRIVGDQVDIEHLPVIAGATFSKVNADTSEEALALLEAGGAHVYIPPNTLTALYQIQKLGYTNIKQVGIPFESVSLSLAVLKERADLLSELSLTLGKIQESEHFQALKEKWFGRYIKFSIWDRYIRYILFAVAGLGLFLFSFAVWNIALKRKVNRITEDLVLSEEKYRELIESSPDMIHIISEDGRIQMSNKRSKELLEDEERRPRVR